jgi:hypothetical protein
MKSGDGNDHWCGGVRRQVRFGQQKRGFDVVMRAGGLTSVANVNGVKIKRPIQAKQIEE